MVSTGRSKGNGAAWLIGCVAPFLYEGSGITRYRDAAVRARSSDPGVARHSAWSCSGPQRPHDSLSYGDTMSDPIDFVKKVIGASKKDADLRDYYADLVTSFPREQRYSVMMDMIIARHRDHEGACKLAWELYLAGTGKTNETFSGTEGDPVEEVRNQRRKWKTAVLSEAYGGEPDKNCYTQPDGECVSPVRCMHSPTGRTMTNLADEVRAASKLAGACGPECGEAHTYEAGSCRMFTFGSGYAPATREQ